MVAESKFSLADDASETVEMALVRAIQDCTTNAAHMADARQRVVALERRDDLLRRLARSRLEDLPENRRRAFTDKYPWLTPGPTYSSRRVFINEIVRLFLTDLTRTWSTPDISAVLQNKGIHVESKRIFNTLSYLAADGRIVRLARGHYRGSAELSKFDTSKVEEDTP